MLVYNHIQNCFDNKLVINTDTIANLWQLPYNNYLSGLSPKYYMYSSFDCNKEVSILMLKWVLSQFQSSMMSRAHMKLRRL